MNKAVTLTKRETQMAELLAWGLAKKEVADRLYVSTRTVEATTRNIYEKIGIQKASGKIDKAIYQEGRTIIIDRKLAIELLK